VELFRRLKKWAVAKASSGGFASVGSTLFSRSPSRARCRGTIRWSIREFRLCLKHRKRSFLQPSNLLPTLNHKNKQKCGRMRKCNSLLDILWKRLRPEIILVCVLKNVVMDGNFQSSLLIILEHTQYLLHMGAPSRYLQHDSLCLTLISTWKYELLSKKFTKHCCAKWTLWKTIPWSGDSSFCLGGGSDRLNSQ
jgi:hypothetical protein